MPRTTISSAPQSRATPRPARRSGRRAAQANGDIYKGGYAGWYSVRDEAYYGEEETEVRPDNVRYGPQGTPVEWVEEESYFFRLSAYQDKLLALYDARARTEVDPDAHVFARVLSRPPLACERVRPPACPQRPGRPRDDVLYRPHPRPHHHRRERSATFQPSARS